MVNTKRLMTTAFLLAIAMLAHSRASAAQDKTPDKVVEALSSRVQLFLEGVSSGQSQKAYQTLLARSDLLKRPADLKKQIESTDALESRYGRYRGFERIAARRVGKDLVLMKYLYKCERFPVVWYFAFYRTPRSKVAKVDNADWRVIVVRFDTNLEALLSTKD